VNLNNFMDKIDPEVVMRGLDYFEEDRIISLACTKAGSYVAVVRGSDVYRVTVALNPKGDILRAACDCPYDGGPYCKHEVAVFLALAEMPESETEGHSKSASPDLTRELSVALQLLDREELERIILDHAKRANHWAQTLLIRYVADEEEHRVAQALIWASVDGKEKIKDALKAVDAVRGAELVLDKAAKYIEAGRIEKGLDLCALVLDFAVQVLLDVYEEDEEYEDEYYDDVDEGPSTLDDCLEVIEKGIKAAARLRGSSEQGSLFAWVHTLFMDYRRRQEYDVAAGLLAACFPLARDSEILNELRGIYNEYRKFIEAKYGRDNYTATNLRRQLYALLREYGTEEEVEDFLQANLSHSEYREEAIKRALAKEEYGWVVKLAEDGQKGVGRWSSVPWKEYIFTACEKMGDIARLRTLSEEFLFEQGFKWYPKVKAMYAEDTWPAVQVRLLKRYRKEVERQDDYMMFLRAEKLTDELLACCRMRSHLLEWHCSALLEKHYDEAKKLFREHILKVATEANSRYGYQAVCKTISKFRDAFGNEDTLEVVGSLSQLYPRKRAFMEELKRMPIDMSRSSVPAGQGL